MSRIVDKERVLDDLLKEKNLWAIYVKSRQIPFSRLNCWIGIGVGVLACCWTLNATSSGNVLDQFQALSLIAFDASVGLLGFLLAGFSFFATVYDKKMFCRMAEFTHSESGLSYLKYNFFSFMRVFCEFLVMAVASLIFAELFAPESGGRKGIMSFMSTLAGTSADADNGLKRWFASLLYGFYFGSLAYLLMQLNSFIFNIYHVSMSSIRWALEEDYGLDTNESNATNDKNSDSTAK